MKYALQTVQPMVITLQDRGLLVLSCEEVSFVVLPSESPSESRDRDLGRGLNREYETWHSGSNPL